MSEASREQHPLLCEDLSEEERFTEYPRGYRPMVYRGRSRNNAKGAAAIITRWPEHWSSTLTYWWIGLSMISLTIFLIYNTLIAFVLLPPAHMKPVMPPVSNKVDNSDIPSKLPEVYMHIFSNTAEEVDINKYLPNVENISDKHLDFNFNLIIVYNDTINDANTLSAEENNEIAFNSLWGKEHFYKRKINNRKNVNIKYVVLSHLMDESPLKKDWRNLPYQFMEFLVNAISIWDKGGIAINPTLLNPLSPHFNYIEKFENILHKFKTSKKNKVNEPKNKKYVKHKDAIKQRVNNIRDIIDILEHEDLVNYSQENLTEAENKNEVEVVRNGRKLLSTAIIENTNKTKAEISDMVIVHSKPLSDMTINGTENTVEKINPNNEYRIDNALESLEINNEAHQKLDGNNKTSKLGLLPLFLEYLFHDKANLNLPKTIVNSTRHRKSAVYIEKQNHTSNISNRTEPKNDNKYKPMIIPAKGIIPDELLKTNDTKYRYDNENELTIDLNGSLIATKTPCHAFIGSMFSNIVHHTAEETMRDFMIAELSVFCKGLLSSCRGVDVILI